MKQLSNRAIIRIYEKTLDQRLIHTDRKDVLNFARAVLSAQSNIALEYVESDDFKLKVAPSNQTTSQNKTSGWLRIDENMPLDVPLNVYDEKDGALFVAYKNENGDLLDWHDDFDLSFVTHYKEIEQPPAKSNKCLSCGLTKGCSVSCVGLEILG